MFRPEKDFEEYGMFVFKYLMLLFVFLLCKKIINRLNNLFWFCAF